LAAVARASSPRAASRCRRASRDRLVPEEAPQIIGERSDRGVALGRVFLEGPGYDRVEIAAQLSAESLGSGRTSGRDVVGLGGTTPSPRGDGDRGAIGLRLERPADQLGGGAQRFACGMPAGQEQVKKRPQSVDVGRRRDDAGRDLFGSREFGRQRPSGLARQCGCRATFALSFEELGDAEVEQLHVAAAVHEHVGRFDVAMDDQVRVGVGDRFKHLEKELEAPLHTEALRIAIFIDRPAFDVFENQVGLTRGCNARIDQARNVRIRQTRENLAFAPEALLAAPPDEAGVEEFQGGPALEAAVAPMREPDVAHPALADQRIERVRAEDLPGDGGTRNRGRRAFEKAIPTGSESLVEECLQLGGEFRISCSNFGEVDGPIGFRLLEDAIQMGGDLPPPFGGQLRHVVRRALPGSGGAGRCAPSPTAAAPFARKRRASQRSQGRRSRRRT
jgi:hypothetical protein